MPEVWSPAGPVLGVSVGPDLLCQSKSSSAPWVQIHRLSSKEQPYKDRAEERKKNHISQTFTSSLFWGSRHCTIQSSTVGTHKYTVCMQHAAFLCVIYYPWYFIYLVAGRSFHSWGRRCHPQPHHDLQLWCPPAQLHPCYWTIPKNVNNYVNTFTGRLLLFWLNWPGWQIVSALHKL